ncbi:hypothetical protein J2W23_000556 [Variovorax boronicumulans]|uniref:hypothetical protein n=1 Tax=Variovorax boronicumulans TaxID=436515 RepID=UPI00159EA682|nr:hypothetical protein [Variovorax boronicumulans]MDQ0012192.1 hypothetical protein [Variovorax boronicumulans]
MFSQSSPQKVRRHALIGAVVSMALCPLGVHAAQSDASFAVKMSVNAPQCTVKTSSADIKLPTSTSPEQTAGAYLLAAGFDTVNKSPISLFFASKNFDQTATITCSTPATPIRSFLVHPTMAPSATRTPGAVFLVDSKGNKAANGTMYMTFEQLKVNGVDAPHSFNREVPYKAESFLTENKNDGVATVVWRPVMWFEKEKEPLGTPEGGRYAVSGQIVVDY